MNLPQDPAGNALQTTGAADLSPYTQPANMWLDPANDADAGVNLIEVLHSLRRRWLPAFLIGSVLGTLLAALCWVLVPITYEAEGLLRVRMNDRQLLGGRTMSSEREYEVFKQTQAALLTSPFVLNAALRDPAVQATSIISNEDNPIEFLSNNLRANYSSKSELLTLSLRDDNKEEVITIVDAVLNAYREEVQQSERNDRFVRLEALQNQFTENQRSMRTISDDVHNLAQELGTVDSEEAQVQQKIEIQTLSSIDRRRQKLREQFGDLQTELAVLQQKANQSQSVAPHEFDVAAVLERDPRYAQLKEEYDYYQTEMSSTTQSMRTGSPMMSQMQTHMQTLDLEMKKRAREIRPRIVHMLLREMYGVDATAQTADLSGLQTQAQVYLQRIKAIDQEYAAQVEKVRDMSGFSAELVTKKSDLEGLESTNMDIGKEVASLKLNLSQPSRIQLLQQADVPDASSLLFKLFQVAGAWLAGFALTVVGITAWDYLSRRLNTGKDLEKGIGLGVIGALPQLTGGFSMFGNRNLEAAITDSVDSLRAAIMYGPGGKLTKSVVVTSALGGEGKSTVASQLAVSLARSGRRTILVDGDIRKPQQHAIFGMPADIGLCDVLRGHQTVENVVQATPAENLWILPAGGCDNTSFQALSGMTTPEVIKELVAQFDFVVVDSGPVLTGPEALIFGQHVDGAILSTRRDISRVPKIEEAKQRLASVNIRVLGAVLNGANTEVRAKMAALPTS